MALKVPRAGNSDDPAAVVGFETELVVLPRLAGAHVPRFIAASDLSDADARPVGRADGRAGNEGGGLSEGIGVSEGSGAGAVTGGSVVAGGGGGTPAGNRTYDGPCAAERRLVDERCEIANRARARAADAEDRLRGAQRAYDEYDARADAAEAAADPRAVQRAKDEAQATFRAAGSAAATPADAEAPASAWLVEINRINAAARNAATELQRSREAASALVLEIERLATEAGNVLIQGQIQHQLYQAGQIALLRRAFG